MIVRRVNTAVIVTSWSTVPDWGMPSQRSKAYVYWAVAYAGVYVTVSVPTVRMLPLAEMGVPTSTERVPTSTEP